MRFYISVRARLGLALAFSSLASVGLFVVGAISNHSGTFAYLNWNLFLAWVPLVFTLWLEKVLRDNLWSSWRALILTILWLGFLPNTFYMISDFIHVQDVQRVDLLYDVVMFSSFIFNGVILGFVSLFLVHKELLKRLSKRVGTLLVALILLACSFAIYLGRDLRWNTWDVLINPASVLFDVSDPVINPRAHPQTFSTTLSFFVLLGSLYIVAWHIARNLRHQQNNA